MKERSFLRRNKRVQLQELTDVVALHKKGEAKIEHLKSKIPDEIAQNMPASQLLAFENAGWILQERASSELSKSVPHAKVFLKPNGSMVLGTNMLSVKFKEDLSEEEANKTLKPYGCQVKRKLTFAPGLFQVAITEEADEDLVDMANRLSNSGLVEFAEPELIEVTGPRS